VAEVPLLNELARECAAEDVQLYYLYVREAHPGDLVTPHRSYEEKLQRARALHEEEGLELTLLVDGFDGPVHRAYGEGANMACIVHRDGRLVYRAEWTDVEDLRREIEHLRRWDAWAAAGKRYRTSRVEKIHAWFETDETYEVRKRTYARAGELAVRDFVAKTGRSPI